MDIGKMFVVEEYFDGKLVKEHEFFTYEGACAFYEHMFKMTKNTYYVRYAFRGITL